MSKDVFLSHTFADEEIAAKITAGLQRWGIDVWIAPDDISGGRRWGEAIVHGIRSCDGVVYLSSEQSHDSEQTEKEVGIADEFNKPIIPVRLDESDLPDQFRYHLAHIQWITIEASPTEEDYEQIARAVDARCSEISIAPPQEIAGREEKIADEVSNVLQRNVDVSVIDLQEKSEEFVKRVRESIAEQRNSYVIEIYDEAELVEKYITSRQDTGMSAATNYLIENYDLMARIGGTPWVPGRNKPILKSTDEVENSSNNFKELDSGYYLNIRIDREYKMNHLETMCEACGLSIQFHGKW